MVRGPDGISTDIFKSGGENITKNFHELIVEIEHGKEIPPDLANANSVIIYKLVIYWTEVAADASPYFPKPGRYPRASESPAPAQRGDTRRTQCGFRPV